MKSAGTLIVVLIGGGLFVALASWNSGTEESKEQPPVSQELADLRNNAQELLGEYAELARSDEFEGSDVLRFHMYRDVGRANGIDADLLTRGVFVLDGVGKDTTQTVVRVIGMVKSGSGTGRESFRDPWGSELILEKRGTVLRILLLGSDRRLDTADDVTLAEMSS